MSSQTSNMFAQIVKSGYPVIPNNLESYRNRIAPTAPHILEAETADGIVLHDDVRGMQFPLDLVWSKVWRLLKAGQSFDSIAESLVQQFSVARETIEADLCAFIGMLEDNHLLASTSAGSYPVGGGFWRTLLSHAFRLGRQAERES